MEPIQCVPYFFPDIILCAIAYRVARIFGLATQCESQFWLLNAYATESISLAMSLYLIYESISFY